VGYQSEGPRHADVAAAPFKVFLSTNLHLYKDAPIVADRLKHPVVIFSHGAGGNGSGYAWFGEYLASRGYIVAMVYHYRANTLRRATATAPSGSRQGLCRAVFRAPAGIRQGCPGGSPEATRRAFNKRFLLDLAEDWQLHGRKVFERVRRESPAMAKHVWVDREWHLGGLADTLDEPMESNGADWPAALGNEYVGVSRVIAA